MSAIHKAAAKAGLSSRWRGPDHPETLDARRELLTAQIAADIERRLADAPRLTEAQQDLLAALIRGGGR